MGFLKKYSKNKKIRSNKSLRKRVKKNRTKRNKTTRKHRKPKNRNQQNKRVQKGGGTIPKIVHQIWFGSTVPEWRKYLFDLNASICAKCGYQYKLWTEDMRTNAFFESTHGYQRDAIKFGKEQEQSRWAQVADLARIEILYKQGGIYLDSLFEISVDFLNEMTKLSDSNKYIFIGANEDPCKFNCKGNGGRKYLSNGFFAAKPWCEVLERLLSEESLDDIDLRSQYINRTTGPYYLRSGITDDDIDEGNIYLFDTEIIYPFNVNETDYSPARPNLCLKKTSEVTEEEKKDYIFVNDKQSLRRNCMEYINSNSLVTPKPLTIYQSGLGGTWSY